jgi:1-acyl-sn-glycerol-3-phosphate acyltransferase
MIPTYTLTYPRRVVVRRILRTVARGAMKLLTRTQVNGRENLPAGGPLILVGNHVAIVEVVLMVLHVPWLVEVMGVGDVPLDPTFALLINTYGYIPIKRGSMDRAGMTMALDVLRQDGVVGIFPEGGIWEASAREARSGVAWLSSKASAPIVPIGFGGVAGALEAMLQLKRPHLTMNIGQPLPPVSDRLPGISRKQALSNAASEVMARIEELIPAEDRLASPRITDEQFELQICVTDASGGCVPVPAELHLVDGAALAKVLHRPVLLRTLARNVRLPVQPLQQLQRLPAPAELVAASEAALNYLENDNRYFLSYRFGSDEARAMQQGLAQFLRLAQWATDNGYRLQAQAVRRYRLTGQSEFFTEYAE